MNKIILLSLVTFLTVPTNFSFAVSRPSAGEIKPFDWDKPKLQEEVITPFGWDTPLWTCPESEQQVGQEVATCINYCYSEVLNEKTGKMESVFENPVMCKLDKCYPKGRQKLVLYQLCAAAKKDITKQVEKELDAFIVKIGGYIHITHADGTGEDYGSGRDIKGIKFGDEISFNEKSTANSALINFPGGSEIHVDSFSKIKFLKSEEEGPYAVLDGKKRYPIELGRGRIRIRFFSGGEVYWPLATEFTEKKYVSSENNLRIHIREN